MTRRSLFGLCAASVVVCAVPIAQEREDRTLLTHEQMRAIINEASGDRAMHRALERVPYPRIRPTAKYHFRESEVMAGFAKEYGYSTVEIESFPAPQRNWAPTMGELWMVAPEPEEDGAGDLRLSVRRVRADSAGRGDGVSARARTGGGDSTGEKALMRRVDTGT